MTEQDLIDADWVKNEKGGWRPKFGHIKLTPEGKRLGGLDFESAVKIVQLCKRWAA